MRRLIGCLMAALLTLPAFAELAPAAPLPGEQRAEAFMKILAAPTEQRRSFVQDNFTAEAIARRGLDGLVAFLAQVHGDLGDAPPRYVRGLGDRVEFGIAKPNGENLRFTVMLGPPPEGKIAGFTLMPDETAEPPPSVAEADLPKAIAEFMQVKSGKGFSGAVIVAYHGRPIFAQAYGEADRATHRANTLDTPFNLASDNKMFTAVLIAQLQQEGKLAWGDTVGKFLPDWPQAEVRDKVTIENLLTHTSGLGDYWGPAHDAKAATLDTVAEYADLIRADAPAAEPGKVFKYSNNGYVLLGLIAEKITGKNYYDLVGERIYAPAGMDHSDHYLTTDAKAGVAIGYEPDGSPNTAHLALRGSPAGGGYASANDLLRFATALEAGTLVSKGTLAQMITGRAAMGPDMAYGYGFGVTQGKEKHYGHDGGSPGVNASFEQFPESGYTVVVLSNKDQGSRDVAQQLVGMVLARK
jgi:CubicO group peptidase (beta-lactamase class C family)